MDIQKIEQQYGLKTIRFVENDVESTYAFEHTIDWHFYKKINHINTPFHLKFELEFHKRHSAKEVEVSGKIPLPQFEAILLVKELIETMKEPIQTILNAYDIDRVRKITSGERYEGDKIVYKGDLLHRFKYATEQNITLENTALKAILTQFADRQLGEYSEGTNHKKQIVLVLYGQVGRSVAELLESHLLGKVSQINANTWGVELLFPFADSTEEKNLSGMLLASGPPLVLQQHKVMAVTMAAEKLRELKGI